VCAGVSDNRLQNVVITLDKVKLCLERPGQPPPSTTPPSLPDHAFHHMQSSLHIEKKRKDYVFWRCLNEKPSMIPGCPGSQACTLQLKDFWTTQAS